MNAISTNSYIAAPDYCALLTRNAEKISKVYRLAKNIIFKKMQGGIVNPPIVVLTGEKGKNTPIAVVKAEKGREDLAAIRLKILQNMKSNGFTYLPEVFRNINGKNLTKLEGQPFYFIQYIHADKTAISFDLLLTVTGDFHQHAKNNSHATQLKNAKLDEYISRSECFSDPWFQTEYSLFRDADWREIVKLSQYFNSAKFRRIYENLPTQLIHGDNNQTNILLSNKIPYFIDFDSFRLDVRLLDIVSYFRYGGFDRYLELSKSGELFTSIDATYGKSTEKLSTEEKASFHLLVAFSHIEFMSWALMKLKNAQIQQNKIKKGEFYQFLKLYKAQMSEVIKLIPST